MKGCNALSNGIYFNPNHILSYDKPMNFIIADRGYGKTYSTKKYAINRHLKHGEQFVYIKRFKDDLAKVDNFFNKIQREFPDHEFTVNGKTFFCDGNICGYAIPLSSWQKEKSNEYPDVKTIIYDEFIKEKDLSYYLPNEVESFLNLVDTIVRDTNDFRVFLLGNAVTLANPYFLYFKLYPQKDQEIYRKGAMLVNIPKPEKFRQARKQTTMGLIMQGTNYEKFALYSEWKDDNEAFIEKRTPESKYVATFTTSTGSLGLWHDKNKNTLYLSKKLNMKHKNHFVMKKELYKENRILVTNFKQNYYTHKLGSAFLKGQLRFDNLFVREVGYDILKELKVQ